MKDGTDHAVQGGWAEVLAALADRTLPAKGPLAAPLPEAGAINAMGVNYADHAEAGMKVMFASGFEPPKRPGPRTVFFTKPSGACVTGPGATVAPRPGCEVFDLEVELCTVIGRPGRDITEAEALSHVADYTVSVDMSGRDFQVPPGTLFGIDLYCGKVFDGACPIGPVLVPAAAIPDPQAPGLCAKVNGETWQDGSTAGMILPLAGTIPALSRHCRGSSRCSPAIRS